MLTAIFILLVLLSIASGIAMPVVACIFVYSDAKKRGMNAPLWVLLTLILSIPLGLIVYLIAREQSFVQTRCPNCGEAVMKSYSVCPRCGNALHANCPNCGSKVQPGWNACPNCGTNVSGINATQNGYNPEKRGMTLKTVVIAVIVLFAVLIMSIIGIVGVSVFGIHNEISENGDVHYEDIFEQNDDFNNNAMGIHYTE